MKLYHATYRKNIKSLLSRGIVPNKSRSIGVEGFYKNYSTGKIFLTEESGLYYWKGKLEDFAEHYFDDADDKRYDVVFLECKFPDESYVDWLGTHDSGYLAVYTSKNISNKNISEYNYVPFLKRNTSTFSNMIGAIQHVNNIHDYIPHDFNIHTLKDYKIEQVTYTLEEALGIEDSFGWIEIEKGELVGLSSSELFDALNSYRGEYWASQMTKMIKNNDEIDPIIVVEHERGVDIGDGRGRLNLLWGLGVETVNALRIFWT